MMYRRYFLFTMAVALQIAARPLTDAREALIVLNIPAFQ